MIRRRTIIVKDGQPCGHKGCAGHKSHPCEECGRIECKGESYYVIEEGDMIDPKKYGLLKDFR